MGLVDLGHGRVRDPGHQDLAGVEEVGQGADGLCIGHAGIRPVVLVEANGLGAQRCKRCVARLLYVRGVSVNGPAAVSGAAVAAFGGDEYVLGGAAVGLERLGNQPLSVAVFIGAEGVGIRSVDDGDPRIEGGMDRGDRLFPIGAALNGEGHLTQSNGAHLAVSNLSLLHAPSPFLRHRFLVVSASSQFRLQSGHEPTRYVTPM